MIKKWFFVTRPWSFVVSAMPVIATVVYLLWKGGYADFSWLNAVGALVGIVLFHAAGNVLSDYFDYKNGIDAPGAFCIDNLVSGEFQAKDYLRYAIGLFAVACVVGILLTLNSGWLLLAIGVPGLLVTLLYSRAKFIALGETVIFLLFGVLPMIGTSYVTIGVIDWSTLLLSVPVGFVTVAVLHANNTRDIPTDSKVGARSMSYFLGGKAAMVAYIFYIVAPCVFTIVCVCLRWYPVYCLTILLSLPIVWRNIRQALRYNTEGLSAFNTLDLMSAQLQMVSGFALVAGFILGIFV